MSRSPSSRPSQPAILPPPGRGAAWAQFLKWAVGVPVVVAGALGAIWLAFWAAGSAGLMLRTELKIGEILMWLGLIALLYPVALVVLVWDLIDGLRAARAWEALPPEAQAQAMAAADAEIAAAAEKPRRSRRKGKVQ
ncbi:hypothetical protein [Tabrizicola flagellatus]|uniref:hypothetical protein n=1 Tax=Tabrizicola flagellatus TaxID=2593021 RepID=UPI0011F3888C|nr:hypothetical protein [Tabrizicola flagellatus]